MDSSSSNEQDVPHPDIQVRQRRQALVIAVGLAAPIVGLDYAGPILQSSHPGGFVWWHVLQAALLVMLIVSHACGPILARGVLAIRHMRPDADLLWGLALLIGLGAGTAHIVTGVAGSPYFGETAVVIVMLNASRFVAARWELAAMADSPAAVLIVGGVAALAALGHSIGGLPDWTPRARAAMAVLLTAWPRELSLAKPHNSATPRGDSRPNASLSALYHALVLPLAALGLMPPAWSAAVSLLTVMMVSARRSRLAL